MLNSTTLREIAESLNPKLREWAFEQGKGLVFRELITKISIGYIFLVSWSPTPAYLKTKQMKGNF